MNNDLISRQAAIALAYFHGKTATWDNPMPDGVEAVDVADLEKLPAVQIEQKTGRWIDDNCSECGQYVYHGDANNYCPNCGAKMEA